MSRISKFFIYAVFVFYCISLSSFAFDANFDQSFSSGFFQKRDAITQEEKEKRQAAKQELQNKKIKLSTQDFIKNIKDGNIEVTKLFLDAGISPNADFYTDYPIYYAVKNNRLEITKLLLEHGANPNLGFESPLYMAVKNKNLEMVQLLLDNKAKPNYIDFITNDTMLYWAIKKKQYEIAKALINAGASIDPKTMAFIQKRKLHDQLDLHF